MTTAKILFPLSLGLLLNANILCQSDLANIQNNINVVFGQKHIFTIETPANWINDRELARSFSLVCFFYPSTDSVNELRSYIYALGIDKSNPNESLNDFLSKDLKKFRSRFPDFTYDLMPGPTEGMRSID